MYFRDEDLKVRNCTKNKSKKYSPEKMWLNKTPTEIIDELNDYEEDENVID